MASDQGQVIWEGASGKRYTYWAYPIGQGFQAVAGNYIFAKHVQSVAYAIYVGETSDLSERFDNHHKAGCIQRNGATHIHAHGNANREGRLAEEADIIAKWNPPCNG